jgi:hypothetical protein
MDQKYRNNCTTYNTNFNNMQYQYVQPDRFVYPYYYSEQTQNQQVNYQNTLIQEINYYKGMIMNFMREKQEYIEKEESYKNKIQELEKIIENNNSKYNVDIEVNLSNQVDKLKSNKLSKSDKSSKPTSGELSEYANILTTIGSDIGNNKKKRKNNNQIISNQSNIFNHRLLNFNYNSEINKNIQKPEDDDKTNISEKP